MGKDKIGFLNDISLSFPHQKEEDTTQKRAHKWEMLFCPDHVHISGISKIRGIVQCAQIWDFITLTIYFLKQGVLCGVSHFGPFGVTNDGSHIPPHGPKGAGSKGSVASPEWQVVNRAKRKWASVWRPIANNAMGLEAMTIN